jgi:hypothetical protein
MGEMIQGRQVRILLINSEIMQDLRERVPVFNTFSCHYPRDPVVSRILNVYCDTR